MPRFLPAGLLRLLFAILFFLALATAASAQGSRQDYDNAKSYNERFRNKVFRQRVRPNWIDGGPVFWYRIRTAPEQHEFVHVDPQAAARTIAFDHNLLAEQFARFGKSAEAKQLPLRDLSFDEQAVEFQAFGSRWRFPRDGELLKLEKKQRKQVNDSTAIILDSLRASGGATEDTSIRFVNKTQQTIKIAWVNASNRRIPYGDVPSGATKDQHTFAGHTWLITGADGKPLAGFEAVLGGCVAVVDSSLSIEIPKPHRGEPNKRPSESTHSNWTAFIKEHNVHLRDSVSGESFSLSTNGSAGNAYKATFSWSPDGKYLAVMQETPGESRTIYHIESSPGKQLQPVLHDMEYAKPGDVLAVAKPRLFDIARKEPVVMDSEDLYPNAWRISQPHWSEDSSEFRFLYNARGHQTLRVVALNVHTKKARAVINEESKTFIDYAYKKFLHRVSESNELIWMSERSGWNHLYRYDGRTGRVENAITSGDWVVRGVERVDDENRQIWFRGSGVFEGQDPYYVHLGRVDFDGNNLTWLTRSDGTHKWEFSPDGSYLIDTWSRVDHPPVTELRRSSDGAFVCELETADIRDMQSAGWIAPEPFVAKGRDGKTDICGVIVRPINFSPDRSYPVIEKIYAGPHGSFVPKSFQPGSDMAILAEHGFIVVQIDGMGTSNRSKAFHDVCWKNLGDSGFPDRIAWLKSAKKKYPQLDLDRVGIYGGSAGGQSALRALLAHGDFYKAAAADCGCHDNRMDKVWWNELWMGWPIGPHYDEQSNVTQAHRLTGKLLLTVGELDRNVDPASTMQVVDALIKADKDFDLLVVPGAGHGVGERPYAKRRRTDFFVRHLLDVEPRHE